MAIKKYKPTSPGRRFATYLQHEAVTKGNEPEKSLTEGLKKSGGRNTHGRVTARHRGGGGQLGRSAGTAIQLVAKEGKYATLRLPSGEMRMVQVVCRATIGALGNAEHELVDLGKAGRSRHRGKRPQTRGVAMNPVDHPDGRRQAHHTPGGHPVTPWGVPTLGYRTRKKRKTSDRFIVRGRRRGKKGRR